MADIEVIAKGLTTKAAERIKGKWPVYSYRLHLSHIRHFNRNRLIEPHNTTHYRLTHLGLAVRAALEARGLEIREKNDGQPNSN